MRSLLLLLPLSTLLSSSSAAASADGPRDFSDGEFLSEYHQEVAPPRTLKPADVWRGRKLEGPYPGVENYCAKVKANLIRSHQRYYRGQAVDDGLGCIPEMGSRNESAGSYLEMQWLHISDLHYNRIDVLALKTKRGWYFTESPGIGTPTFKDIVPGGSLEMVIATSRYDEICGGCDGVTSKHVYVCGLGKSKVPSCTRSAQTYRDLDSLERVTWRFDYQAQIIFGGTITAPDPWSLRDAHRVLDRPHRLHFP